MGAAASVAAAVGVIVGEPPLPPFEQATTKPMVREQNNTIARRTSPPLWRGLYHSLRQITAATR